MHTKRLPARQVFFLLALALLLAGCAKEPIKLNRPNGVVVERDGSVYVQDFGNHRIVRYDKDGLASNSFSSFGIKQDQIFSGWDIALDTSGNIYFVNSISEEDATVHDGVKVFSPDGRFLREIGAQDYDRASNEQPNNPYGLDVDSQGRVFIADYGTGTLRIFDGEGHAMGTFFGGDTKYALHGINDVAVDDRRGLVYLDDFMEGTIDQYRLGVNESGGITLTYQITIGSYGRGPNQLAFPQMITVDKRTGLLYVGDLANRRIQIFDYHGNYISSLSPGIPDWQVMGISVSEDGSVYAADAFNHTVWIFKPNGEVRRFNQ